MHTENNIASESLATEQKVEKVKAELSAQRSTEEVDEALALIDTEGLTAEEIKAEVTKLLFKRGLAEKNSIALKLCCLEKKMNLFIQHVQLSILIRILKMRL